ncbi:hypothetical protein N7U66_02005 [Lacinutrix neustonica]|uniref:Uncharacterized protein n=1 Tax=Lacinutrix neustonica TaxID=2980107 RepID=A0A9E8SHA5_9FLAO|nr:hypothetical protein [Lacinutrix neustonica]WAC02510.1 hypothetical protein N7U66_02005 [Lacinutrix neustonica]
MSILTAKYLVQKLGVSLTTAKTYINDMKDTYPKAKRLTTVHYIDYFENLEREDQ